ncbi:MAG: hypothetical protein JWN46_3137 [Acidimicrobiales bacterium]|nr:hypothetical protein [Acidimicrobiales bacterium]
MGLFKKRTSTGPAPPPVSPIVADLPTAGAPIPASLAAHSGFIKRAVCTRCGAPKTLPSITAYLYCDFCASLIDYDFRIANADTNAGLTNTVFHRLVAPVSAAMQAAIVAKDRDAYRTIQLDIFRQWVELCPQAVSPRAKTDEAFRERLIAYLAEAAVTKDLEPSQLKQNAEMEILGRSLQRIPTPDGAWRVAGPFWEMAALFKAQMEQVYALLDRVGVLAMDPDEPPPGVALRMECSTFCQGWLPHLSPEDGVRLLAELELTGDYVKLEPQPTLAHTCGGCGAELQTVPGARIVVCEACGRRLDIAAGPITCRGCGASLSFPVGTSTVACPACHAATQRV